MIRTKTFANQDKILAELQQSYLPHGIHRSEKVSLNHEVSYSALLSPDYHLHSNKHIHEDKYHTFQYQNQEGNRIESAVIFSSL